MIDEKKEPPKAVEGAGAQKPATEGSGASPQAEPEAAAAPKAPAPAGAGAGGPSAPPKPATPASAGSGAPGAPAKPPAAPPAKPPAAAAKAAIKPDPWSSPLLGELQKRFPGAISEAVIFRKMPSLNVAPDHLVAICQFLKSPEGGAYTLLTDETAVDYPKREKRFDIIYHLYSFRGNDRLRLRVLAGLGEKVPSVVSVWPTANWMEREIFDMFGVAFDGHPDLKRLLMPEEWVGHPLRKDYDILKQDKDWVKSNLGIESAQ